jgi:hypothetical protein
VGEVSIEPPSQPESRSTQIMEQQQQIVNQLAGEALTSKESLITEL